MSINHQQQKQGTSAEGATYLVGVDDENGDANFKVQVNSDDRDDVHRALALLFNKAFTDLGPMVCRPAWTSGVPGDAVVVWGASSMRGTHERYLYVSFQNGKRW